MLLVLILSAIFIPSKSYALTYKEKEEILHDLCEKYEERFDNHAESYSKSLQRGAKHISFSHHRVPQDEELWTFAKAKSRYYMYTAPKDKKFATASFDGISKLTLELRINFLHFSANNTFDGSTVYYYACYESLDSSYSTRKCNVDVSDTSPEAGITRSLLGSLWDLGSDFNNIDQGAFVVLKWDGYYQPNDNLGHGFFKTDCTGCANLMAKFLNEALHIIQD